MSGYEKLVELIRSKDIKRAVPNIWIPEEGLNTYKERWKRFCSDEEDDAMNLAHYYEVDYASMS